jgi:hypothetical protein
MTGQPHSDRRLPVLAGIELLRMQKEASYAGRDKEATEISLLLTYAKEKDMGCEWQQPDLSLVSTVADLTRSNIILDGTSMPMEIHSYYTILAH